MTEALHQGTKQMMLARWVFRVSVILGLLAVTVAVAAAQTPPAIVSGRIFERASTAWIGGATVRIDENPPFITDSNGEFFFVDVSPGRHVLSVVAMGYRSRELELEIRADTVINVGMEVDPVRLEEILVRPGTITIEGTVLAEESGNRVHNARVWVAGERWETTGMNGKYKIKKVPRGRATTLYVSALELMPAAIAIITERDTTINVALGPDSVGIKMVLEQVKRVEVRSRAVGNASQFIDRSRLRGFAGMTAREILRLRMITVQNPRCVFVDEQLDYGVDLIDHYIGRDLERIEVYGRGEMVRVYTRDFMVDLQRDDKQLGAIVLLKGTGQTTCF